MMSVKQWANIFGWVLLVIGVLGFVPGITSGGNLLGIFAVDGLHNIVHIVTGALAIWMARQGEDSAKMYFKIFGVIYAVITILGFISGNYILGYISANMADNILHLVIAALALYLGFGGGKMMSGLGSSSTPSQSM